MNKIALSLLAGMAGVCTAAGAFQLSEFDRPESAVRDPETGAIFVSNTNGEPYALDGNGYISRISPSGSVLIQKFIGGKPGAFALNAPKGLAIWADKLAVADIDKIQVFEKKNGAFVRTIDLTGLGAVFLNDLAFDSSGILYASDTAANKIFKLDIKNDDAPRVLREGPELGGPNGLAVNPRSSNLLIVTWNSGSILELDGAGRIHILKRGLKNLDGIDFDEQWNLYVSSYSQGEIYRIPMLGRGGISVFASNLQTPGDIGFDRRRREILIPLVEAGSVISVSAGSRPGQKA
jgi:DNA-binding beta-propeller fold protein YncE